MPIDTVNNKVKKELEDITTESWLDAESINRIFDTEEEKAQLSELRGALQEATRKNESVAKTWQRIGKLKKVAIKLIAKGAGVG